MIQIRLPDSSLRGYDQPLSVYKLAASICPAQAKAAVAGAGEDFGRMGIEAACQ